MGFKKETFFVCYSCEFVITVIVITEFDCNHLTLYCNKSSNHPQISNSLFRLLMLHFVNKLIHLVYFLKVIKMANVTKLRIKIRFKKLIELKLFRTSQNPPNEGWQATSEVRRIFSFFHPFCRHRVCCLFFCMPMIGNPFSPTNLSHSL